MGLMEETANRQRNEITKIYNDIRARIIERETILKRRIAEALEQEQLTLKNRIIVLED